MGFCPFARSARISFWIVGNLAFPVRKRSLPAFNRSNASSGDKVGFRWSLIWIRPRVLAASGI